MDEVSLHAQQERLEEDLDISEIENAITGGEVIEDYPHDPRGASCLVAGKAGAKSVHVVLGWARDRDGNEDNLIGLEVAHGGAVVRPPGPFVFRFG